MQQLLAAHARQDVIRLSAGLSLDRMCFPWWPNCFLPSVSQSPGWAQVVRGTAHAPTQNAGADSGCFGAHPAAPFPMFYGAGSWAEYCVVSETALVAVPDNVPDEIAAQFFVRLLACPLP